MLRANCTPIPIEKVTEKLSRRDFIEYPLRENQHAFGPDHSTMTALNVVTNDILNSPNKKKPCDRTLLMALDLTAVFDTVDQH